MISNIPGKAILHGMYLLSAEHHIFMSNKRWQRFFIEHPYLRPEAWRIPLDEPAAINYDGTHVIAFTCHFLKESLYPAGLGFSLNYRITVGT
jgi:hypothetical protein